MLYYRCGALDFSLTVSGVDSRVFLRCLAVHYSVEAAAAFYVKFRKFLRIFTN